MRGPWRNATTEGQELSKVFSLRFSDSANLAACRTQKFVQLQRVGAAWLDLTVKGPAGAEQQLFIDIVKSLKQIRTESIARWLHKVLKFMHPGLDLFCKRWDCQVCSRWIPLACVLVTDPAEYKLEWNISLADSPGINRTAAANALGEADRSAPDISLGRCRSLLQPSSRVACSSPPAVSPAMRVLSGNANFVCPADPVRSRVKSARLSVNASEADILAAQETHGAKADFAVRHPQPPELFLALGYSPLRGNPGIAQVRCCLQPPWRPAGSCGLRSPSTPPC
jgi:hypothetical protein